MTATTAPLSLWSPLRQPVFRSLWVASAVSTIGSWMHDTGSAWLMTSLSSSPLLISLMQVATSLPFFLLALPAGAIADVVDRRKMLLYTQGWMLFFAALLGILTLADRTTPEILLAMTLAISIGSAMNMPVWQSVTPELVTREELSSAVTLSGIVINISRSIGPALAGIIIALTNNTGVVFLLNAVSFLGVILVVSRWKRVAPASALPAERVLGAIQAGIRYVRFAAVFQSVLIRTIAYSFFASALLALLPLLARRELNLDAIGYGFILGCWGIGGLAGAFLLPKARQKFSIDRIVAVASVVMATMLLALAWTRHLFLIGTIMLLVGIASLCVMVCLNVSAQTAVPTWVRARALAVQLLVFQGSLSLGSLLWGAIAASTSIAIALTSAAVGLIACVLLTRRYRLRCTELLDLRASLHWERPTLVFEPCPNDGPVLITIEYRIAPQQAEEFVTAMKALSRIRRRDGAIQWGLYQDLSEPGRFVETALVESWAEHKRQYERVTNSDRLIEDRVRAFHIGNEPPKLSQMIYSDPLNHSGLVNKLRIN
jgi:MFS family permease/quinol monooxygenase YgiN